MISTPPVAKLPMSAAVAWPSGALYIANAFAKVISFARSRIPETILGTARVRLESFAPRERRGHGPQRARRGGG